MTGATTCTPRTGTWCRTTRRSRGVPFELQWTGKPYYGGHWDIHVVSAGRMFTAQSSVFQHPTGLPYELVARSAYNGQVLWRRPIAKDFGESASLVVATPERLFLKDGGGVLVLDPETGAEIRRIAATAQRVAGVPLAAGVRWGPADPHGPGPEVRQRRRRLQAQRRESFRRRTKSMSCTWGRNLPPGTPARGAELWRFAEAKIDPAKLAAADGRVYLYANRSYAACLDLKSGKQIWKTAAPIAEPKGPGMGWIDGHATVKNMSIHRQGAVATKDVYFINYLPHRQCQAFAAADGRLLWDKMHGPAEIPRRPPRRSGDLSGYQVVLGTSIIEREWQIARSLDRKPLSAGKQLRVTAVADDSPRLPAACCSGQMGEIYDLKAENPILQYNAKSSCGTGQFVADGLLFKVGANCPGCSEWRGFFASRSAPQRAIRGGPRLETAAAGPWKEIASDAGDWTTYRSDATRKGSSAAVVPADGAIRWIYAPARPEGSVLGAGGEYLEGDVNPAQAVAVGDRVWIGTAEGAVVCVDRKTGAEAWRYWTAGRIMGSPTWWRGRLYVGSCDGWVYCLDAATGTLAWRYRAGAGRAAGDDLGPLEQRLADHGQRPGRGRHRLRRRRPGRPTRRSRALRAGCQDRPAALGKAVRQRGCTAGSARDGDARVQDLAPVSLGRGPVRLVPGAAVVARRRCRRDRRRSGHRRRTRGDRLRPTRIVRRAIAEEVSARLQRGNARGDRTSESCPEVGWPWGDASSTCP